MTDAMFCFEDELSIIRESYQPTFDGIAYYEVSNPKKSFSNMLNNLLGTFVTQIFDPVFKTLKELA